MGDEDSQDESGGPRALAVRATCAATDRFKCDCAMTKLHGWYWGGVDVGFVGRSLRLELPPLPGGPEVTINPLRPLFAGISAYARSLCLVDADDDWIYMEFGLVDDDDPDNGRIARLVDLHGQAWRRHDAPAGTMSR